MSRDGPRCRCRPEFRFLTQAVDCDRALLLEQLLERPGKRPDRTVIVEFLS
jgi:hypothetical protein